MGSAWPNAQSYALTWLATRIDHTNVYGAAHGSRLVLLAGCRVTCNSAVNWRERFQHDPSVLVREACLAKIVEREGREGVPFALGRLADPDWRIRATAVESLLLLGEWGVRAALATLRNADETARIAIGRLAATWADGELLDEFLHHCPQ